MTNVIEIDDESKQYFETKGQEQPAAPAESAPPQDAPAEEKVTAIAETTSATAVEHNTEPEKPVKPPQMVDKRALDEARIQLKEFKKELNAMRLEKTQTETKLAELEKRLAPPAKPVPAFEESPAEHLLHEVKQTKESLAQMQAQEQQRHQIAQFQSWYAQQAQDFAKAKPDFYDAYKHFTASRLEELTNAGLSAQQAQQRLLAEEYQLVVSANQIGLSPAQMIYQTATMKGYKQAQPKTATEPASLERIAKGVQNSKPLSAVGGGGSQENLTWESVANMPDDQFLAAFAKMAKKERANRA